MSLIEAYLGGFSSFFSIWVYCLMQIIPFYCAYVIGASLMDNPAPPEMKTGLKRSALTALIPFIGFTFIFVSLGMTSTSISKTLFSHAGILNQFGGVTMGLVGLYFIGALTLDGSGKAARIIKPAFGLLFGVAIAMAYKPCVTPALTKIYNITQFKETVITGGFLIFVYSLGVFTAIGALAIGLTAGANSLKSPAARSVAVKACGALLIVVSVLVLTDNMSKYKAYLVGRFAPQIQQM